MISLRRPPRTRFKLVAVILGAAAVCCLPARPAPERTLAFESGADAPLRDGRGWDAVPFPAAYCWSPGTPKEIIAAFDAARRDGLDPKWYFEDQNRWHQTATDGAGLGRGDPTVLTWGFAAEGTLISTGSGTFSNRVLQMLDAQYGAGPGGDDLTQRPWFPIVQQVFDRWSELIGISYVYEPEDDGAAFPQSEGVLGVRADVRLSAAPIDGHDGYNIYAFNYFPDLGDMVMDTDNAAGFGNPQYDSRFLRNVMSHEHGHGIGLAHSCPIEQTKLMEPTIALGFDGPQHDDILGGNRGYGDGMEGPSRNDTYATAADLGLLDPGDTLRVDLVTIDGEEDVDFYAFTVPPTMRISATLTPVGFRYFNSPGEANDCPIGWYFDSLRENNPGFELIGKNGSSVLTSADYRPVGLSESVENVLLSEGEGTYFVKAFADTDKVQMYELWITASAGEIPVAVCKDVRSCQPSVDALRVNNGSYDPDGDEVTLTLVPEAPFPAGENNVTLIVSDGYNADSCQAVVTINTPPTAVAQNLTVPGDTLASCQAAVSAAGLDNGSFDPDGDALTFALAPPGPFPQGQNAAKFIVIDRCSVADTVDVTITVTCSVPVTLSRFTAQRQGDEAVISWAVADAQDHSGFHLYRQTPGAVRERLTDRLLAGREEYEFTDASPPAGPVDYWLEEWSRAGRTTWHGPVALEALAIPAGVLLAVHPNPFAERLTLTYTLPDTRGVTLEVFDLGGRRVRTLVDRVEERGEHRMSWDGRSDDGFRAVPGLYVMRLLAGEVTVIQKAVLLRSR